MLELNLAKTNRNIGIIVVLIAITFIVAYLSLPLISELKEDIRTISHGNKQATKEISYRSSSFNPISQTKPLVTTVNVPSTTTTKNVTITVYSNKKLQPNSTYELTLIQNEKFYEYKLELLNLKVGANNIELVFSDTSGNSVNKHVNIFRKSKAAAGIPGYANAKLTVDGNSLTALVSKEYKLSESFVPEGLVALSSKKIPAKSHTYLRSAALNDLSLMVNDMQKAGLDIFVTSAYRSYDNQVTTYNYWVKYNGGSYVEADRISARPGHSEHQLGTTIDFVNSECNYTLTQNFANTNAGKWLSQNSYKYGFVMSYPNGKESITGYSYEPWHYRYVGKVNALGFKESGLTLIEYLESIN